MVTKQVKELSIDEELESVITESLKQYLPSIIDEFHRTMEESTNLEEGLSYFVDVFYDDFAGSLAEDVCVWVRQNLVFVHSVARKSDREN